jgi:hypothetical protein
MLGRRCGGARAQHNCEWRSRQRSGGQETTAAGRHRWPKARQWGSCWWWWRNGGGGRDDGVTSGTGGRQRIDEEEASGGSEVEEDVYG